MGVNFYPLTWSSWQLLAAGREGDSFLSERSPCKIDSATVEGHMSKNIYIAQIGLENYKKTI